MKHQVEQPEDLTTDYRGTEFKVGSRVAYNYQGLVRLGVIQEIRSTTWEISRKGAGDKFWWRVKFLILVKMEGSDKVSKVRNSECFVCI